MRLLSRSQLAGCWLSTLLLVSAIPRVVTSQTPSPSVSLSFGVDTTNDVVRNIVALTRDYLAHPDSSAKRRGLWSTKSAFDARYGDLAADAYQGFPATIIGVTGTGPADSVFVVKILHASADSTGNRVTPLALERIYAVRAPGSPHGWQFSSPLPRLTRSWAHRDSGPITFWYEPGQPQSAARARQAVRFVDSVARLFAVDPPAHLDAYVTGTMDGGMRLQGLDFFPEESGPGSGLGGRGGGPGILLFGNPRLGEAYLHELVHAVLGGKVDSRNSVFGEGVAVWLGGSEQRSLKELYAFLREYQLEHPALSMTELFHGAAPGGHDATVALYATRGLIVDSVYRNSGMPGLMRFARLQGSADEIIARLPDYINGMGNNIDAWWRAETLAAVKR